MDDAQPTTTKATIGAAGSAETTKLTTEAERTTTSGKAETEEAEGKRGGDGRQKEEEEDETEAEAEGKNRGNTAESDGTDGKTITTTAASGTSTVDMAKVGRANPMPSGRGTRRTRRLFENQTSNLSELTKEAVQS